MLMYKKLGRCCCCFVFDGVNYECEQCTTQCFEGEQAIIDMSGVDINLGKLIKLINAFKTSTSTCRLSLSLQRLISNLEPKTWHTLIQNTSVAFAVYVFLNELNSNLNPYISVTSSILIESLQDCLNEQFHFQDEWEVSE